MSKMLSVRLDEDLLASVDHERERGPRAISRAEAVKQALALWVEQRRLADAVRRHREGYERAPVSDEEFGPVLGTQRWPK